MAKGIIDVSETLTDTHTGVDSCMYDTENGIIILGEAKFYRNLSEGFNKIIRDFKKNNIKNKLESLKAKADSNEESYQIILKNLSNGTYDELSLKSFLNQKILFTGFVLHSEQGDVLSYNNPNFYDGYNISSDQVSIKIQKELNITLESDDYSIVLVHLPVQDKKNLIIKVIEKANNLYESL